MKVLICWSAVVVHLKSTVAAQVPLNDECSNAKRFEVGNYIAGDLTYATPDNLNVPVGCGSPYELEDVNEVVATYRTPECGTRSKESVVA